MNKTIEPVVTSIATEDVPERDDTPSRLLTLPPEVRNLIFAYVLTNHHIHIRYIALPNLHWSIPRKSGYFFHHALNHDRAPPFPSESHLRNRAPSREGQVTPLWRVCKQLYAETLYTPFSKLNVFSFEDWHIFQSFIKTLRQEQIEGIREIWICDDNQSAMYLEVLAQRLAEAQMESKLCDMTVYIQSRIQRMEELANDPYSGPLSTHKTLRAGWDLAFERRMIRGLTEIWERLVERVVVREV